jgi:hypothetical protein
VKLAGSDEVRSIRSALRNQSLEAPEGPIRIDAETQHTHKIARIQPDGQFEIVWQTARPEPPIPYPASRSVQEWKDFLFDLQSQWQGQWAAPK